MFTARSRRLYERKANDPRQVTGIVAGKKKPPLQQSE